MELETFSNYFLKKFSNHVENYSLEKSYTDLLGLGIMIVVEVLKWDSQYPKSIQVLAISISLKTQSSFLIMNLIWFQVNLSGPGADELLHFSIALINSCLEKGFQLLIGLLGISSKTWISISLVWAELKELCRVIQRSSSLIYECPSYWIALIAGSLCFLTQFMRFYRLHFLLAISSILSSKKDLLVFLTMLLKLRQFSRLQERQYFSSDRWQSLFHHALECLVIFISLEFFCHDSSMLDEIDWTISLRVSAFWIMIAFTFFMIWMTFSMNWFSSSLPFTSDHHVCDILSSWMDTLTVIRAWSDESLQFGWIWWRLNSGEEGQRNTKSRTELALWLLLENLVEMFLRGLEISKENESIISKRELCWGNH